MEYDNNNTGIISKNDKKQTDKHPDISGQCEVDGVGYWVDGWARVKKDGTGKFYSLKFKPKDAPKSQAKPQRSAQRADDDGSIPF